MWRFRWLVLTLALHLLGAGAVAAQGGEVPSHEQLRRLDREIQELLTRTAADPAAVDPAVLRGDAERFRDRLQALDGELAASGGDEPLRAKLRHLLPLVANLERAAAIADRAAAAPPSETRGGERVRGVGVSATRGTVPNDACAGALPIALGDTVFGDTVMATLDGQSSCGALFTGRDVWFSYTADNYGGHVSFDTFGSAFDTVLSVHTACPGTTVDEVACNDDAFGLQSATSFHASPGTTYYVRVAGFDESAGAFELHAGTGGDIVGTVTAAADGSPLTAGQVIVSNRSGFTVRTAGIGGTGEYRASGLFADGYNVSTRNGGEFLDELFDNLPCPLGVCDKTTGTPVALRSDTAETTIDFALERGAAVAGTVTDAMSGLPVTGAWVRARSPGRRRRHGDRHGDR